MANVLQFSGSILYHDINKLLLQYWFKKKQIITEFNLTASIYQNFENIKVLLRNSLQITITIIQRMKTYKMVLLFWGIYKCTLQIKKKKKNLHLLAIYVSSLGKCLFRCSVHFSIGLSVFLVLNCMSCLFILEINHLSVV